MCGEWSTAGVPYPSRRAENQLGQPGSAWVPGRAAALYPMGQVSRPLGRDAAETLRTLPVTLLLPPRSIGTDHAYVIQLSPSFELRPRRRRTGVPKFITESEPIRRLGHVGRAQNLVGPN